MLDCLIIGDSIAVGTATARPECASVAQGGINTWQFNRRYQSQSFDANTVIISLGSNDHKYVKTQQELETLRSRVHAAKVFWILPAGNLKASEVPIVLIQDMVYNIAKENGDTVIPINRLQADGIHPSAAGYRNIAQATKQIPN